ncbi:MAG TPA: DUF1592 domain-containing protein [Methylomirabilota bacterium]|nr:DUF1592 domain-containing protein [Methylomirabilota bacterium]
MRIAVAIALLSSGVAWAAEQEEFDKEIKPLLKKHCYDCHGSEKVKGDLNLETFQTVEAIKGQPEIWNNVRERVAAFEMPPEGKYEMSIDRQGRLMRFLRTLPRPDQVDCDEIASDRNSNGSGYAMSRRLNRAEYSNTIRDLFGMNVPVDELLPTDGGGGEGFDTTGNALFISTIHIEKYIAAAGLVLETVLPDKTRGLRPEIKHARESLLGPKASPSKKEARASAEEVVSRVMRRAFRRPVEAVEVEKIMGMFDRAWNRGDGYVPSLRLALQAVLVSPNFLFLAEPEPAEKGVQPLAPIPLASKLSYFLWSSMPDEELLQAAESGRLNDPNVYVAQVRRMLKDPKAAALGKRFALQWLDLEKLGTEIKPDSHKYPEFNQALRESMLAEVTEHFNYILAHDRPLTELIAADYTFLNEELAGLYGIEGVKGEQMRRVQLADARRGGVIGMAAVHASTSYPLRTSPVLRGRWVLESLIGEKVKPPPPDVPALEEHSEKTKNLSLREQLQMHRENPDCASCHDKMDPLGFGMENFDALGRWRELDKGLPIDASGKLPSGEAFTGPAGLKTILMSRKSQVMTHLVRKMTGYAFGRELNRYDACVVKKAVEALERENYKPSVLVEEIVLSFPFRHRFYPKVDVKHDG